METKTCCPEGSCCPECEYCADANVFEFIADMFVGDDSIMGNRYETVFADVYVESNEDVDYIFDRKYHFVDRNVHPDGSGFFVGCIKDEDGKFLGYRFDFAAEKLDYENKAAFLKINTIRPVDIRFEHQYFVCC